MKRSFELGKKTTVRVEAPHFVAAIVLDGDVCTSAAPILANDCLGKRRAWLRKFFEGKNWKASVMNEVER